MKTFLKRLFLMPVFNCSHLILCVIGYAAAQDAFNYSVWLYGSLFAAVWFLGNVVTAISDNYFEVVENEFEKEDSK